MSRPPNAREHIPLKNARFCNFSEKKSQKKNIRKDRKKTSKKLQESIEYDAKFIVKRAGDLKKRYGKYCVWLISGGINCSTVSDI